MDFFGRQDQARKRTGWLLLYFTMAIGLISLAVAKVITWVWEIFFAEKLSQSGAWSDEVFAIAFIMVMLLIIGGSIAEARQVRRWGGTGLATRLGGRLLPPNTTDPDERRLLNVVEEMALAAGMPPPPVYLLEGERSINAFAAGYEPSDAVLGFTHGVIDHLSREEMQGVVGHEISHIVNGDMGLNLKLMGMLQGILLISTIGSAAAEAGAVSGRGSYRGRRSGGGGAVLIILGLVLWLIGAIGVFFGRLIKSAVSRQREYLADAAAVQFTRNPVALAGALKKVGGQGQTRIRSAYAEQASHLFFGSPVYAAFSGGVMATHPPLKTRILRLDGSFDGTYPHIQIFKREIAPVYAGLASRNASSPHAADQGRVARPMQPMHPEAVMQSIGAPLREHVQQVQSLLLSLPVLLSEAVHDPYGSCAAIYALLLDEDQSIRDQQWLLLEMYADAGVLEETRKLESTVREAGREARLAMVDLAVPALKTLSREQYCTFRNNLEALAAADDEIDLFEFTLLHTLRHHLDAHFGEAKRGMAHIYAVRGLAHECSVLLSMLARLDMETEQESAKAFQRAVARIQEPKADIRFLAPAQCSLKEVDLALDKMATAAPKVKRQIVVAALECLVTNEKISADESLIFRAVSAALDVPVPPWARAV